MKPYGDLARVREYNAQVVWPARHQRAPYALCYLRLRARYVWKPDYRW